jgi:hypothetical protein
VSGFSVTLQNNRLGWIDIAPDYRPFEVSLLRLARLSGSSVQTEENLAYPFTLLAFGEE